MKPTLLIPVENQVRELDPKLLLACIAAKRGFTSIIGSRREMEMSIDKFPRSIYLSKSMTIRSLLFFRLAHRLGHEIITWDEEALVHLPPETYFSRRLDPAAIKFVSHLFAWGDDNAELWRQYPDLPRETPIHVTGNPRSDLLRSDLRVFYDDACQAIRARYGDFILVNTNFNHVNAFGPDLNLFQPPTGPGEKPRFGRAARGMSRSYAEGLRDHKLAVFDSFKQMIPALEAAFPNYTIVVRPHPTEKHDAYHEIAERCQRVEVTNDGNVVPWLMAAKALVHNGCTTGVEAYVMGLPAVSYRMAVDERYDNGFYRLPNLISHQAFTQAELIEMLGKILGGLMGSANGDDRHALIKKHLAGQDGDLACDRMVGILDDIGARMQAASPPGAGARIQQWVIAQALFLARWVQPRLPGSHNRPEFQKHRFPGIDIEDLRRRIERFQNILGEKEKPQAEQLFDKLFRINALKSVN